MQKIHQVYPVGMVCTVGRSCRGNRPGSVAVVYENYRLEPGHFGFGLLFPNGQYDGFNESDAEVFEVNPVKVCEACKNYHFSNVLDLMRDYCNGRFDSALKPLHQPPKRDL